jgi:hypothetical protein
MVGTRATVAAALVVHRADMALVRKGGVTLHLRTEGGTKQAESRLV